MKTYEVTLVYRDHNEATGISNCTNYNKNISEKTFNEIYKIICNDKFQKEENL